MLKKVLSSVLYLLYILIIVGVGLEVFLRFYSPIEVRISSGKIVLPKNQKYILPNKNFTKLSKDALHSKNSWGFRGPEWNPASDKVKMLFVGGSTTECFYSDDNKVWTARLAEKLGSGFLVNNAGLNGHSTVGHITLLKDYIGEIRPDYVFFLVGINDVATTENGINNFDSKLSPKGLEGFFLKIEEKSRLLNLLHSFYRSYQARKSDLADHMEWKLEDRKSNYFFSKSEKESLFKKHYSSQEAYSTRLRELIEICKKHGAEPVFITQPLLFGEAVDPTTGVDLSVYPIYGLTGKEYGEKLEIYNETLRKVAMGNSVGCIDLWSFLPKESALYTDDMHFSDKGAEAIAEILYDKIHLDSAKRLHIKE